MDPEKRGRIMTSIRSVSKMALRAKTVAESGQGAGSGRRGHGLGGLEPCSNSAATRRSALPWKLSDYRTV